MQRLKKSLQDLVEDTNGCSGSDPKFSANRQSCLPAWPRLGPGEEGNSRRGTRRLSLVQVLSHLTRRISGPSGSDVFVSSATPTFFLLWARPASLWTHIKFLTTAASRRKKFTLYVCVRRGNQTKRTKPFVSNLWVSLLPPRFFWKRQGALDCHSAFPCHSWLYSLLSSLANEKVIFVCNFNQHHRQRWDFQNYIKNSAKITVNSARFTLRLIILKIPLGHSIL